MVGVGEDEFWREMDEQNRSDENDKILEGKELMKMNRFGLLQMKGIRKEQILFQMHKLYDLQK